MTPQEQMLLEAERRGLLSAEKQSALNEARKRNLLATPEQARFEELKTEARARTAAGEDPWYHALPGLFGDPIGVMDEFVGGAGAAEEAVKAPFRKGFWSGETTGLFDKMARAYREGAMRTRALREVRRERFGLAPEFLGAVGPLQRTVAAIARAPTWLARAGQSAKVGGGYGAAAGFAQSEGGVGNRLVGSATGAATGAGVGVGVSNVVLPAAGALARGMRRGVNWSRRAVVSARRPEQAAVENLADRLEAAGISPAQLRAALSPGISRQLRTRGFSEADMADIISRQMQGEPAVNIAQDYAHLRGPNGRAVAPATLRRYYRLYMEQNPTPLNIADVAQEIAGPGGAKPITRLGRAAYSLAGDEAAAPSAQALLGRQHTQAGRVSNIVQRTVGGGDFEARQAAAATNLRQESERAYRQFYAEPDLAINDLADLMEDPLFRRANTMAQRQARVEVIRRNQQARAAGGREEPVPEVDPSNEVFSPQLLDLIQRQLRIAGEGYASNPNAARHAQNLRQVLLDRIEQFYPTFRPLRQSYATGMMEQQAMQAGEALTTRLGAPAREALRGYEAMTPAQQELFRLGFGRNLQDLAANPRQGRAVADQFSPDSVRQIIERIFRSDDPAINRQLRAQGEALLTGLRREALTTSTAREFLSGSRTAELQSDMSRMQEAAQTAADMITGRVWTILNNLSTRLATQIGREGASQILRMLTETDPARLLPLLNRLERASRSSQQRRAYVAAIRELRPQMGIYARIGRDYAAQLRRMRRAGTAGLLPAPIGAAAGELTAQR